MSRVYILKGYLKHGYTAARTTTGLTTMAPGNFIYSRACDGAGTTVVAATMFYKDEAGRILSTNAAFVNPGTTDGGTTLAPFPDDKSVRVDIGTIDPDRIVGFHPGLAAAPDYAEPATDSTPNTSYEAEVVDPATVAP